MAPDSNGNSSIKSSLAHAGNELQAANGVMAKGCPVIEAFNEKVREGPEAVADAYARICADEKKRMDALQNPKASPQVLFQIAAGGGKIIQAIIPPLTPTLSGKPGPSQSGEAFKDEESKWQEVFTHSEDLQQAFVKSKEMTSELRYPSKDIPFFAKLLQTPTPSIAAQLAPYVILGTLALIRRKRRK